MTSEQFCFWLQGYIEIATVGDAGAPLSLSAPQVDIIRRHLNLAFKHDIDPKAGDKKHQEELNAIHHPPAHFATEPKMRC